MAKALAPNNIAFQVSTGNSKQEIDKLKKQLASVNAKGLEKFADGSAKAFAKFSKETQKAQETLLRLQKLSESGGNTSLLANQLRKQVSGLKGTVSGKQGGGVAQFGNTLDDLIGGKFSLQKGAKFGIGGLIASFVSDTLAGTTDALVKARNNGSTPDEMAGAFAKSLPVLGGIATTIENVYELATGTKATQERYNNLLRVQNDATKEHLQQLRDRKLLIEETARSIKANKAQFEASLIGGKAGVVARIGADSDSQDADAQRARDAAVRAVEDQSKALKAQNLPRLTELKSRSKGGQIKSEDNNEIKAIEAINAGIDDDAAARIKVINAAYEAQKVQLEGIRDVRSLIAQGLREDTKAVEDQLEGMAKQSRTMSGDPFEAARKSFAELKPTTENLAKFNIELDRYREALDRAEAESRKFQATQQAKEILRGASTAGLNSIDATLAGLLNAGVTDKALIARVKIKLEADEAKAAAAEVKRMLENIQGGIRQTLAGSIKDRVAAEVDELDRQRRAASGVGYTPEEKAALTKAKLDAAYAGEAAQTREDAKLPSERLRESLDSLQEQFKRGFIDERQLRSGVGSSYGQFADNIRTSRPELMAADSAQTQAFIAATSGKYIDSSRPELRLATEQLAVQKEMLTALKEGRQPNYPLQ